MLNIGIMQKIPSIFFNFKVLTNSVVVIIPKGEVFRVKSG